MLRARAKLSPATFVTAIAAVALAARVVFASVRQPFFDELFTRWICSLAPSSILAALQQDSGPPLYYLLGSVLVPDHSSVVAYRLLSISISMIAFAAVILGSASIRVRFIALAILAVLPVHVAVSADARAYALLASLTGLGCVLLFRWIRSGHNLALAAATVSIVLAAYTHWYGLLFLPLIPASGLAGVRSARRGGAVAIASAVAALALVPALLLLARQPSEAAEWMRAGAAGSVTGALRSMVMQIGAVPSSSGVYSPVTPPLVALISSALFVAVAAIGVRRSIEARLWAIAIAVPACAVLVLIVSGRAAYFPVRFESALSVPIALLVASSLDSFPWARLRSAATAGWVAGSALLLLSWALVIPRQLEDPWRLVAIYAEQVVPAGETLLASGPMYLEMTSRMQGEESLKVVPFPREQAAHPGWRARVAEPELRRELQILPRSTAWTGEPGSAEAAALATLYHMRPVYRAGPVALFRLSERDAGTGAHP